MTNDIPILCGLCHSLVCCSQLFAHPFIFTLQAIDQSIPKNIVIYNTGHSFQVPLVCNSIHLCSTDVWKIGPAVYSAIYVLPRCLFFVKVTFTRCKFARASLVPGMRAKTFRASYGKFEMFNSEASCDLHYSLLLNETSARSPGSWLARTNLHRVNAA
jgi:hypothetical protein